MKAPSPEHTERANRFCTVSLPYRQPQSPRAFGVGFVFNSLRMYSPFPTLKNGDFSPRSLRDVDIVALTVAGGMCAKVLAQVAILNLFRYNPS